eukprot:2429424-Pleurochrysis_carterae.AAC.5
MRVLSVPAYSSAAVLLWLSICFSHDVHWVAEMFCETAAARFFPRLEWEICARVAAWALPVPRDVRPW